jgi:beta-N-acetylhexosaminidase
MARLSLPRPLLALAAAVILAAAGVGVARLVDDRGGRTGPAPTREPSTLPSTTTDPASSCTPAPLEARAGAVLVVGLPGVVAPTDPLVAEVSDVGVGGVLLTDTNVHSVEQTRSLVTALRAGARRGVLVTIDEEGGRVSSVDRLAPRWPSARRLGQQHPDRVREVGRDLGSLLESLDVDLALAPVADLDTGPAGGVIGDRSFGGDPGAVATSAVAFAAGLRDAGVMATAKHFPGHGRAADSHGGPVTVAADAEALRATELVPFRAVVADGVPAVMLNHVAYSGLGDLPASLNPAAYELLRSTGFEGVAVTDSLGMGAINLRWPFGEAAVRALGAGADAVLATDGNHAREMRDAIVGAVTTGRVPEARLDEAVARVLTLRDVDPATMVCA